MKIGKIAFGVPLIAAVLLSFGCGNIDRRPPSKPTNITVDGVDIKQDENGRIVVSRNGEEFERCGKRCNVYSEQVKVDSITTKSLGGGCSTSVTLVGYQLPVVEYEQEESSLQVERLKVPDTLKKTVNPSVGSSTKVHLSSATPNVTEGNEVTLFPLRFMPKKPCLPKPIDEPNNCCSYYFATDSLGHKHILPRSEDPDCQ